MCKGVQAGAGGAIIGTARTKEAGDAHSIVKGNTK